MNLIDCAIDSVLVMHWIVLSAPVCYGHMRQEFLHISVHGVKNGRLFRKFSFVKDWRVGLAQEGPYLSSSFSEIICGWFTLNKKHSRLRFTIRGCNENQYVLLVIEDENGDTNRKIVEFSASIVW